MKSDRRVERGGTRSRKLVRVLCSLWLVAACSSTPTAQPAPADSGASGGSPLQGQPPSASTTQAKGGAAVASAGIGAPGSDSQSVAASGSGDVPARAVGGATAGQGGAAPEHGGGASGQGGSTSRGGAQAAGTNAAGAAGLAAAAGAGGAADPAGPEPASCQRTEADATTPTIYVIGDSTASVYGPDLYPRTGWAQPLQDYFPPACAKVRDEALSGRSSKSFYDEGAWTPIDNQLRAGDFVLIQFGHNDEKRDDPSRYTEPFGSYQQYLGKYIDDTLAAQATPILLTSIERNKWDSGKLSDTHGDYPEAVRELAQERGLTLVDMTALTHAYFERIGQAQTTQLFMNLAPGQWPNYPNGNSDNTHLQEKGARVVASIALAELARQRAPIAALLDHVPMP